MESGSGRTKGGGDSEELGLDAYSGNFNSRVYWSASLIDDLLDQIIRVLERADATCDAVTQARRADGSINRRVMFRALDEQLKEKRAFELPRNIDGFWPRIVRLFGSRWPYILSLKQPASARLKGAIEPISEAELLNASTSWSRPLAPSGKGTDRRRKAPTRTIRQLRTRDPETRSVVETDVENQQPVESVGWLRQSLAAVVSPEVLQPFQYKGRTIDGPEMILSQAKAHLTNEYTSLYEDFTPDPNYTDFDLEEYLDYLLLFGLYEGRVSLKDVLVVRGLLVKQRLAQEIRRKQSKVNPAVIDQIVDGYLAGKQPGNGRRDLPFKLELSLTALRNARAWRPLPSVSYRLPSLREEGEAADSDFLEAQHSFRFTIRNIQGLEESELLASQFAWPPEDEGYTQQGADSAGNNFPSMLRNQLDPALSRLRVLTKLAHEIRHQGKIAPRPLMSEVFTFITMGLSGESWKGVPELKFCAGEFNPRRQTELALLRDTEKEWLEYVCTLEKQTESSASTTKDEIIRNRVAKAIGSRDPSDNAFFGFGKQRPKLTDLGKELNRYLSGPVKKVKLNVAEASGLAKLQSMKLLHITGAQGSMKVRRLQPEYYPEERIVWDGRAEEDASDREDNLPNPDKLNIEKNDEGIWHQKDDDRDRTATFYRCLGYRLGYTLRQLGQTFEKTRKAQEKSGASSGVSWHLAETSTVVTAGAVSGGTGLHREIIRELHETEEVVPENHGRFAPAREKLWTFGHRNNKQRAPQFFNINKWPRSGDNPPTQLRGTIADTGNRKGTSGGGTRSSRNSSDSDRDDAPQDGSQGIPGDVPSNVVHSISENHPCNVAQDASAAQDAPAAQDTAVAQGAPDAEPSNQANQNLEQELDASQEEDARSSSSAELDEEWPEKTHMRVERRSVHLGKFWGGDTRRQETFLVDQIRQRFETRPPVGRRSLAASMGGLLNTGNGKRKRKDDRLSLPTPDFVPQSRDDTAGPQRKRAKAS